MKSILLFLFLVVTTCTLQARIYITHVHVVDVVHQEIKADYTVVVQGDKIEQVGPSAGINPPLGSLVIDGRGKWLMPGLVDAHVHFFQSGGLYTRPDALDLRSYHPYEEELAWCKDNMGDQLRRYLYAGITTVIDDGASLALLQYRDSFRNHPLAPRIFMAGPLISTNYMPHPFETLSREDAPFFKVTTEEEAAEAVRRQLAYLPDFIKIWYIVRPGRVQEDAAQYLGMVQAATREARKHHLDVAVHAPQRRAAELAVESGARHLVHSIDDEVIDDQLIRLLREQQIVLCPTLTVHSGYTRTMLRTWQPDRDDLEIGHPDMLGTLSHLAYLPDTALSNRYQRAAAQMEGWFHQADSISRINLNKLVAAGVPIATGTDAGNIGTLHASSYYKELKAMQQAGLSNWQILTASTLNGAKASGREKEFGSIEKGKSADMLLLHQNPLEDLAHLKNFDLVMNRGILIQKDTLLNETPGILAQKQLNAYNAYDLETFLDTYTEDVEVYDFPDQLQFKGKEEMRKRYDFIRHTPGLHARISNRIVQGNMVIDHEEAYIPGRGKIEVVAMYLVSGDKISKVYFKR